MTKRSSKVIVNIVAFLAGLAVVGFAPAYGEAAQARLPIFIIATVIFKAVIEFLLSRW
jgi:hypothetical protein